MAVADASFKIVNVSISFGLIMLSGLATPEMPALLKGIPSNTIKGSLLALKDEPPRIRIVLPDPGAPPLEVIATPATLPVINCSGLVMAPFTKSLEPIVVTEPVKSFLRTEPYPITTTSLSAVLVWSNDTCKLPPTIAISFVP